MKLFKAISILTPISICLSLIGITAIFFQEQLSSTLALAVFLTFYISIILSGDLLVIRYANTTKTIIKKIIIFSSFLLIIFGLTVIYNLLNFSDFWHILIGITIIFLLIIQLNILGWSNKKHSILLKLAFSIVLITNIFLALFFLFKLDYYGLRPVIIGTIFTSISFLIIGIYNTPKEVK